MKSARGHGRCHSLMPFQCHAALQLSNKTTLTTFDGRDVSLQHHFCFHSLKFTRILFEQRTPLQCAFYHVRVSQRSVFLRNQGLMRPQQVYVDTNRSVSTEHHVGLTGSECNIDTHSNNMTLRTECYFQLQTQPWCNKMSWERHLIVD